MWKSRKCLAEETARQRPPKWEWDSEVVELKR